MEQWAPPEYIWAKICDIENKSYITCDCLLDEEQKYFETRKFPIEYFGKIPDIKLGAPITIVIKKNNSGFKVQILDGTGMFDLKLFESFDLGKELSDF